MWVEKHRDKFKFVERFYDENGKAIRVSAVAEKNTPQTRRLMQEVLNGKIEKLKAEKDKSTLTFKQVADEWLSVYQKTVKLSTYMRVQSYLKTIPEGLYQKRVADIEAHDINIVLLEMVNSGRFKYETAKHLVSVVGRVLRYAYKYHGINKISELSLIEVPHINKSEVNDWKYLTKEELAGLIDFLESIGKHQIARAVKIQTNTGMRYGEMVALDYMTDIDLDNNTIFVSKTYDPATQLFTLPKTGKPRTIFFNDTVKQTIRDQIEYVENLVSSRNIHPRQRHLFLSVFGNPLHIRFVNNTLKKYHIEGKELTTHIFRHTFITLAVEAGIPKELIAKQVGHADTNMIEKVYAHFTKNMEDQQKNAILGINFT
ncbi:TPA: tyrosine-type recombinase/integrase [Streptococcus suis]